MAPKPTAPHSNKIEDVGGNVGKCPACKMEGVRLKEVNGLLICEKCSSKRFSNRVRQSIQEAFERQQEQKKREAWRKRIELARRGVKLYEEGKMSEALKTFKDYVSILEHHYGVGVGGLTPSCFSSKKDAGEMLLMAGIYWDMAKIYDHMKGHQSEMRSYLHKFIEFSIDRPHIILASEAIRKYIGSGRCMNQSDFKNAHSVVQKHLARCFIATAVFGPTSHEVDVLRAFRDGTLAKYPVGRAFTRAYYKVSPPIAITLLKVPSAAWAVRNFLRPLTKIISRIYKNSFHPEK